MDGLISNSLLITSVVSAAKGLDPSNTIGLKITALTLGLKLLMESQSLTGPNKDYI
jgi:hypothetical protein